MGFLSKWFGCDDAAARYKAKRLEMMKVALDEDHPKRIPALEWLAHTDRIHYGFWTGNFKDTIWHKMLEEAGKEECDG
jgi:hypothetical protein